MFSSYFFKNPPPAEVKETRFSVYPLFSTLQKPLNDFFAKEEALHKEASAIDATDLSKAKSQVYVSIRNGIQSLIDQFNQVDESKPIQQLAAEFLISIKHLIGRHVEEHRGTLLSLRDKAKYNAQLSVSMLSLYFATTATPAGMACGAIGLLCGYKNLFDMTILPESARIIMKLQIAIETIHIPLNNIMYTDFVTTHYKTLGVNMNASFSEINRSYRKLALQYHPDKLKQSGADDAVIAQGTQLLQKINEAHAVLKDPSTRALYDRQLLMGMIPLAEKKFEAKPDDQSCKLTIK